jgi:hypothetical protein
VLCFGKERPDVNKTALSDGMAYTEITLTKRNSRIEITEILGKLLLEVTMKAVLLDARHPSAVQSYAMGFISS